MSNDVTSEDSILLLWGCMFIKEFSQMITIVLSLPIITFCGEGLRPNHIGNLGGVPVDLPKNLVHLVEYDGDPAWGEKREGSKPTRSYDSKINSFGFDMRYTDNTILDKSNKSLKHAYDEEKNLPNSPWVSVNVTSGNRYYGAGGIHRMGDGTISASDVHPVYRYEQLDNN